MAESSKHTYHLSNEESLRAGNAFFNNSDMDFKDSDMEIKHVNLDIKQPKDAYFKDTDTKYPIDHKKRFPREPIHEVKEIPGPIGQHGNDLSQTEHIENVEPEKQLSRGQRWKAKSKRHCKRWWCCYTLGTIIGFAIFLPVLFLVIIPAIVQHIVNNNDLPIQSGSILQPSPQQITLSMNTSIKVPKPFTITLKPVTLFLYNNYTEPRTPFAQVSVDQQKLHGNSTIAVVDQRTNIQNMDELQRFLKDAFLNKYVPLSVYGNTTVQLGALKPKVNIKKTLVTYGLDKLRGFGVKDMKLIIPPRQDGTNLAANLSIPNHSLLTLGLGNLTLNLLSGNLTIGQATVYNVIAKPGNNTFSADGQIYFGTIFQNINTLLQSQGAALRSGELEVGASGNKTIYDGQPIKYLDYVLNDVTLTTRVPIMTLLTGTLGGLLGNSTLSLTSILSMLSNTLGQSGGIGSLLGGVSAAQIQEARMAYKKHVLLQ